MSAVRRSQNIRRIVHRPALRLPESLGESVGAPLRSALERGVLASVQRVLEQPVRFSEEQGTGSPVGFEESQTGDGQATENATAGGAEATPAGSSPA